MTREPLPLYRALVRLRELGLPLGSSDMLAMQRALTSGIGVRDRGALLRLCQMLWAKSREESRLVQRVFDADLAELDAVEATPDALPETRHEPLPPQPPPEAPRPTPEPRSEPSVRSTEPGDDSARRSAAIAEIALGDTDVPFRPRDVDPDDFLPLTTRQMKQSWRRLRRLVRRGPLTEPDVDATVQRAARDGWLIDLLLRARQVNDAALLLLVDREGSMIPFYGLARRWIHTATRGGKLAQLQVFYFHNCPQERLYRDPQLVESVPIESALSAAARTRPGVLVFSDAGAARRAYSPERIADTARFARTLREHFRHVGWMNPVPRNRWRATSAAAIAREVPMFEFSLDDVNAAVRLLRGRRPWIGGLTA